jgi:hypothetical protein
VSETPEKKQGDRPSGLGLDRLAMRQIAPAEAEVPPQQVSTRLWGKLVLALAVLAVAATVTWWVRVGSALLVSPEKQAELAQRLKQTEAAQFHIARELRLKRADLAFLEVAPEGELAEICRRPEVSAWAAAIPVAVSGTPTPAEELRVAKTRALKLAALEALEAFRKVEPRRDLRIVITQQGLEIGRAEHFRRDGLPIIRKARVHLGEEGPIGVGEPTGFAGE